MNEVERLHEALNLIYYYNHGGEQVQENIKKNGYNKRPIYYFFPVLIRYSPEFANYYQKAFNAPSASMQSQMKTYVKKMLKQRKSEEDLDAVDVFLYKCYTDQTNYNKLWQITQPKGMFSASEISQLERYGQSPTGPGAGLLLASLLRDGQDGYGGGGGGGGGAQAEPTISDLVAKITDVEKITEEDKKKAAEILNNKIKLHENDLKDPKLHAELVKKGHLTQAELDSIVELNKTDFKTAEEKEKTTLDVAERLLKNEVQKREELRNKTPEAPLILPKISIRPLVSRLNIPIHNLSNKIISSTSSMGSNLVRFSGRQALNGTSSLLKSGTKFFGNLNQFKAWTVPVRAIVISVFISLFVLITIMSLMGGGGGEAAPLPTGTPTVTLPPGDTYIASCPATGNITTPSYDANPTTGHCSPGYSGAVILASCCGTSGRRAKSIDVSTGGNNVVLPQIQGQTTGWTLTNKMCATIGETYPCITQTGEEGGVIYEFTTKIPNSTGSQDIWSLQLTHMQPGLNWQLGESHSPQTPVGKTVPPGIVHISIGKNVSGDCVGWIAADFMCQ